MSSAGVASGPHRNIVAPAPDHSPARETTAGRQTGFGLLVGITTAIAVAIGEIDDDPPFIICW